MSRSEVFERLANIGNLPTPSRVALEIMRLYRDETSSLGDIAAVVETDPALSSKLLQYANSAMVSPGSPIASIPKATVKLGMKTVMNLALGFSLLSQNKNGICKEFDYQTFWSFSLAKAVAARSLTRLVGQQDPDELFVCGLLAHIGSLALASLFPEEYSLIFSEKLSRESLLQREHEQFDIDNQKLSGELFSSWGFPESFSVAVSHCNGEIPPDLVNPSVKQTCNILSLAGTISEICMLEMPLNDKILSAEESASAFGLEESDFSDIFDSIVENWQKWGHIFQVPTKECPLYQQIKEMELKPSAQNKDEACEDSIKVLLVDDDPLTLLNLERMLRNSGKTVYTAENGEDALRVAVEKQPHMIITDWRMPKISGIELCKILRNTSITQHIYIIMLTGKESDDELIQALDAGADDFVNKPFTPRVLEARILSGERIIRSQQMIKMDREVIQKYATRLATANRKLQTMAMTDSLTGLPNRRSALNRLKDVVAESQRHQEPLACIMIDIDHFKLVNDNHGHDIGDQVLQEIADIFSKTARSYDQVSRIGGEEFLVICARSSLQESQQLAERLRLAVNNLQLEVGGVMIQTQISLGVAAWHESMQNGEEMTKAADRALYRAKQLGRNRVEVEK